MLTTMRFTVSLETEGLALVSSEVVSAAAATRAKLEPRASASRHNQDKNDEIEDHRGRLLLAGRVGHVRCAHAVRVVQARTGTPRRGKNECEGTSEIKRGEKPM